MCNAVRNECKGAGIQDTPENLWDFFLDKVRKYLHVCLCFSPVGDKFRIRARNFPRSSTAPSSTGSSPGRTKRSFPSPALPSGDSRHQPELLENLQFHCAIHAHGCERASNAYLEEDADTTTPRPSRTSSSSPCTRTCSREAHGAQAGEGAPRERRRQDRARRRRLRSAGEPQRGADHRRGEESEHGRAHRQHR